MARAYPVYRPLSDGGFTAHGLSRATAARVARRIAGRGATLLGIEVAPVPHRVIRMTTEAVYAVRLHLRSDTGGKAPAALDVIVKRMQADAPARDPHLARFAPAREERHPNYWLREHALYGTTLLCDLPEPLRLPACYARERDADTATIWLEAAPAAAAAGWEDDRFAAIARALGAWQGRTRSVAAEPGWLARGSLAMWTPAPGGSAHAAAYREAQPGGDSVAEETLGTGGLARVRAVWDEREALLAHLEAAPQVLSHGDFWTRNLLAADGADVVAIDWSEVGVAPLAHDLVNFVLDSVWMLDVPPRRLVALERIALDAYAAGWAASRGTDDGSTIERAYRAGARVRFGPLAAVLLAQAGDAQRRDVLARRYERRFEEIFAARAAVCRTALQ